MPLPYRSPAPRGFLQTLENHCLAEGPRPGRSPFYLRVRARVPRALYLNFLARREFASALARDCFRPLALPANPSATPFSILIFELHAPHPLWVPGWLGRLAPSLVQSNWRFYGQLTNLPEGDRSGVLFWCTATDSLLLAAFGRRLARCFPLHRAESLELTCRADEVLARIEPGTGSAPRLEFRGRLRSDGEVPAPFRDRFTSRADYTRWVIDQHLSATLWEQEIVLQEMHLVLDRALVSGVEATVVEIPALAEFVEHPDRPVSCFLVENLEVYLDSIRAVRRSRRRSLE